MYVKGVPLTAWTLGAPIRPPKGLGLGPPGAVGAVVDVLYK